MPFINLELVFRPHEGLWGAASAQQVVDPSGSCSWRGPRWDLYVTLSLRHFRLARSWSLSLGAGAPRRARRIDSEHDPRRRPFRFRKNRRCSTGASRRFSYLANSAAGRSMELGRSSCSQLPGRCTSAPAASARAGGLYVMLSLRHFRLARSWSLSLGAGEPRRARANQGKQGRPAASRPCASIVYKEPCFQRTASHQQWNVQRLYHYAVRRWRELRCQPLFHPLLLSHLPDFTRLWKESSTFREIGLGERP